MYFYCHKHYLNRGIIAITLLLAGFLACEDKGFNPALPVDYPVYFVDTEKPVIFSYVPATGKLDSMPAPFLVKGLKVTPDGKELYVSDYFDSTIIIDIATEERVFSGPRIGISFSRDGSLYALEGKPIQILRKSDNSVIFSDTSTVYGVHFSRNNKRIYGITLGTGPSNSSNVTFMANLQGDPEIRRKTFTNNIFEVIPSQDESKLFVLEEFGRLFDVYNIGSDSVTFSHLVIPGYGKIAMTPNGRHIFITAPGDFPTIDNQYPANTISVFDVESNRIVTEIPTNYPFVTDTGTVMKDFAVEQVAITADGRWLVGLGSIRGVIITIDIRALTVKETVILGTGRRLFRLTTAME